MDIKALRETNMYDKHFDCIEPEAHAVISIEYAIEVLEEMREKIGAGLGRQSAFGKITNKINALKQLIA